MLSSHIINSIRNIVINEQVLVDEPLKLHTTFRIGGIADCYVSISNTDELVNLIRLLDIENIPYFILGNGSNVLFSDEGYRGVIIHLGHNYSSLIVEGTILTATGGALISSASLLAAQSGLSGLEWAAGIPGSTGGGVAMNAGAYGGEMKDIVINVQSIDRQGNWHNHSNEDMQFDYRHSIIHANNNIITTVTFQLQAGSAEESFARMNDMLKSRKEKQPLEYPSAGSTFKRPKGHYAAKLLMEAGLGGKRIGGAMISDKHCGFIVNIDKATSYDVINLINEAINIVQDKFGVTLEPEIIIVE